MSSENSPCNENGRRRGYKTIDNMKELWDNLRYGHLQLKCQNLEKMN